MVGGGGRSLTVRGRSTTADATTQLSDHRITAPC